MILLDMVATSGEYLETPSHFLSSTGICCMAASQIGVHRFNALRRMSEELAGSMDVRWLKIKDWKPVLHHISIDPPQVSWDTYLA